MPRYDDGLDDDGYPIARNHKPVYQRGSEADAGDFNPVAIGGMLGRVMERAEAGMRASVKADSPIETILGASLILCFERGGKPLTLAMEPNREAKGLLLVPQFRWLRYRSDWAIYNPKTTGALLIECDGKDFHSSEHAVEHDGRKDQAAHDMGFLTMRFTGAQIYKDADICARDIFEFIYGGRRGTHQNN